MVSFFLSIVSGSILSGAFAPLDWWFLLPLAISIFLYAVTKTRHPFAISFVFAIVFNFLTLRWSGTFVGLVPVLFLVALQSIFYIPLGFVSYKRNRYSGIWLLLPILLCADELRSLLPFGGFGWNRLSFSQAGAPYVAIAKYFGDSSLAFIAITLGIAFYLLWARAQFSSVAVILFLASILIIVPALLPAQNVRGSASILGIQGNVPRLGLDFNSQAKEVFEYHLKETEIAMNEISSKPDVIVWPENSVDVDPFVNKEVGSRIAEVAVKYQTPIIVGAVLRSEKGPINASIMWNSLGFVQSAYDKRVLTPFGEYIPLRNLAQLVSPLTKNVADFQPGKRLVTHKIESVIVGPVICYEIINDSAVASMANNSNILLVQTNNATFASSAQSEQQLNISRIRAVENNRWTISVSTTGVSALIDNHGTIIQKTKQNEPAAIFGQVQLISKQSLANRFGHATSILLILVSLLIYVRKRRYDEQ
jgi:apolipoprotein N-acyltransferase